MACVLSSHVQLDVFPIQNYTEGQPDCINKGRGSEVGSANATLISYLQQLCKPLFRWEALDLILKACL
eukprot:1312480-Amphidinium_carterae.1